ncbi:MAG: hypothetical protein KKE73_07445 [Proteobacteria bacterium]|nr:hypothetical protein [Pseudomonadota bacterium]
MSNGRLNQTCSWALASLALLLACGVLIPAQALAQPGPRKAGHMEHHPGPGYRAALPGNCLTIMVGGVRYFYGGGIFYHRGSHGYAVVAAPMGAMIPILPPGHSMVVVAGATYYVHSGVYYLASPPGYVVVPSPLVVQPAPAPQMQAAPATGLPDQITVIIENPNGSRTPVTLRRVPDGWLGPKGEIYATLPDQTQLQPYYGLGASGQDL